MVVFDQPPGAGCGVGRRRASRCDRLIIMLALVIAVSGAAGCGSADDRSASSPRQEQERLSLTATPSSVATSPLDQELSPSAVESLGLRRQDAVTVRAPARVAANGSAARIDVRIEVPEAVLHPRYPGRPPATPLSVDVDFGGTCILSGEQHPRALPALPGVAASAPSTDASDPTAWWADATVLVAVPEGVDSCDVTAEAWVSGLTYTGAGATITVRR